MPVSETADDRWPPRRIVAGTLVVCAVTGVAWLLFLARHVLFFLFIAIVLSTAIKPLVALLTRRGVPKNLAISIVYTVLLTALVAPGVLGLPLLVDQAQGVLETLPESYGDFRERIGTISATIADRLPEKPPWVDREDEFIEGALKNISKALNYSGLLMRGGLIVLVVIFTSFLWNIYEEQTIRSLILFLPAERRQEAGEVYAGIEEKVGAYIRGQGLLCLAVGLMSLIAYLLIGLPHAIVLAIAAGILEAVPVFGPILGAIAPMLVALSVDPSAVMWVVISAVVIQQAENYLLVPRIMDRSVGVNAVVTLLAIAAFSALEGLAGAVLAIPIAAIIQLLLDRYLLGEEAREPESPSRSDAISQLRFQAQGIVQDIRRQTREKNEPSSGRNDRVEESIEALAQALDDALALQGAGAAESSGGVTP